MVTHTSRLGCQACSNPYLCTKRRAAETRTIPRVRPSKLSRSRGLTLIAKESLLLFAVLATYTVWTTGRTRTLKAPLTVVVTVSTDLIVLPA